MQYTEDARQRIGSLCERNDRVARRSTYMLALRC